MPPELKTGITWRRWPLGEGGTQGWLRAGLVALLVGGVWIILLLSLPPLAALMIGAAFVGFLLPYYLPAVYRVGPEGIKVQRGVVAGRLKPWNSFASYKETGQGYWLVPADSQKLEPLRAIFLPYPTEPELKMALAAELNSRLPLI